MLLMLEPLWPFFSFFWCCVSGRIWFCAGFSLKVKESWVFKVGLLLSVPVQLTNSSTFLPSAGRRGPHRVRVNPAVSFVAFGLSRDIQGSSPYCTLVSRWSDALEISPPFPVADCVNSLDSLPETLFSLIKPRAEVLQPLYFIIGPVPEGVAGLCACLYACTCILKRGWWMLLELPPRLTLWLCHVGVNTVIRQCCPAGITPLTAPSSSISGADGWVHSESSFPKRLHSFLVCKTICLF